MDVGDIRLYRERWKAVEEVERQELRAMTVEEHWRKLNAIVRFAIETGGIIAVELSVVIRHVFRLFGDIRRIFDLRRPLRFRHGNHGIGCCLVSLLSRRVHRESQATGRRD